MEDVGRTHRKKHPGCFLGSGGRAFRAATVQCREHDIWGSAFAVYLEVADARQSKRISTYFKAHFGESVQHGQIRHLPGGVYWEEGCALDTYQNGAFWATPTGWFVYALDLTDPILADRTVFDMVRHFQKFGACEWILKSITSFPTISPARSSRWPISGPCSNAGRNEHLLMNLMDFLTRFFGALFILAAPVYPGNGCSPSVEGAPIPQICS